MTFGDYEADDAYDLAPADPLQVAVRLHQIRRREALEAADWDDLDDAERGVRVQIVTVLLAWGRRGGFFR